MNQIFHLTQENIYEKAAVEEAVRLVACGLIIDLVMTGV